MNEEAVLRLRRTIRGIHGVRTSVYSLAGPWNRNRGMFRRVYDLLAAIEKDLGAVINLLEKSEEEL